MFPVLKALCALGTPGSGMAPIWRIISRAFQSFQFSTILPPQMRSMLIPLTLIRLPELAMLMNSPRWVPPASIQRVTTISPSATCFSTVKLMSEKAEWYARTMSLMASGPRLSSGSPGGMADVIGSQ